jgi:hypothetical protein
MNSFDIGSSWTQVVNEMGMNFVEQVHEQLGSPLKSFVASEGQLEMSCK